MRILIVEDELPAFNKLSKLVLESIPGAQIAGHIDSIAAAREWFAGNAMPDVVLMDIHLADGSAFDLVKLVKIECPVIYTTAYDEYAMEAFKTSGIDYLLKPVKQEELARAFQKLSQFRNFFSGPAEVPQAGGPAEYKKRFVIRFGEHIKTVGAEEIAYCFSENKATYARTHEGRTYPMDHNLDALESMLDPEVFFRVNRQYLICLKAIDEMKTYSKARVIVSLKPPVKEAPVVSSERAAQFKLWLAGEL
ncbi:MAG: response regulator transcription factor [Flavipsychrobacter sp.]|nr:response regulator transcription factor [Flavipsychrobacter sp.]